MVRPYGYITLGIDGIATVDIIPLGIKGKFFLFFFGKGWEYIILMGAGCQE